MAWDLATAKTYLGIDPGDDTKDTQITGVMAYTLGAIETMLQRGILEQQQTQEWFYTRSPRVTMFRYPIVSIDEVNGDTEFDAPLVNSQQGWAEHSTYATQEKISILYTGGFDPLPADLERVMWEAFMVAWGSTDQDTGGPPADGSGSELDSGQASKVTVIGAFTLDYPNAVSAADVWQEYSEWGWLARWASVLNMYRAESGVGLAIA